MPWSGVLLLQFIDAHLTARIGTGNQAQTMSTFYRMQENGILARHICFRLRLLSDADHDNVHCQLLPGI